MIIIDLCYTYTSGRYPAAQPWTVDRADRFHEINKHMIFFSFLMKGEMIFWWVANMICNFGLITRKTRNYYYYYFFKKIATRYILFLVYAFKNVIFKIRKKNKNKMYGLILITHHNYVTGINSLVTCKTWFP